MTTTRAPLLPAVGRPAWLALGINAVSCLGSGLTMPLLIVYLSRARDFPIAQAGLVLSLVGITGVVSTPLSGPLIDRLGSVRAFACGLLVGAVGIGLFAFASSLPFAALAAVVYGSASGLMWNGFAVLLVEIVPATERGAVFALRYTSANVAFGAGALLSGLATATESTGAFQAMFAVDAFSYLAFAVTVVVLRRRITTGAEGGGARPGAGPKASYREAFRDRTLVTVVVANCLLYVFALSSVNTMYPSWVTGEGGGSTRLVGLGFALNITVLVAVQLLGIRIVRTRRRSDVGAAAAVMFALSWLVLVAPTVLGIHGVARAVLSVLTLGVFAIGEALLSPTLPAIVNDSAPDHLRGRYNAAFSLANQVGPIAAPALAGLALGAGAGAPYLFVLAGACLATAVFLQRAGRRIPDAANRADTAAAATSDRDRDQDTDQNTDQNTDTDTDVRTDIDVRTDTDQHTHTDHRTHTGTDRTERHEERSTS